MYERGYFKDKKITVMGLGLLGRGIGDVAFLAEEGADLIVTDQKSKEELVQSLDELQEKLDPAVFQNITFILGTHRLEDFRERDFILKVAGVSFDSPFIEEARKHHIPIEMSSALFARLPPATIVGITGTRGKSTVTHMVYEVLMRAYRGTPTNVFLGGNVKGVATLPFLCEAKKGDIAVLELDSWQLQGFGESRISPHISVFTTFLPDHLNYYRGDIQKYFNDKAQIFAFHTGNDFLIVGKDVLHILHEKYESVIKSTIIVADPLTIPAEWNVSIPGEHNRENIACAIEVAKVLGIDEPIIQEAVEAFQGVPGRLQFLREYKGIKIYNDTTATTPDATIAALKALQQPIILIMGGADKQLDMTELTDLLPTYCKKVIVLPGTGTDRLLQEKKVQGMSVTSLTEAVTQALQDAEAGDTIVLSPAFASFGMFKNEFDRGEQFNQLIQNLS